MLTMPPISFLPATEAEVPALVALMATAFADDYRRHGGSDPHDLAPYTTDGFFHSWPFGCTDTDRYAIWYANTLIGGIVVWEFTGGEYVLGLLFVAPAYQNQGIGRRAWQFLDTSYPHARHWAVAATPWSAKNRHFYRHSCGFQPVRGANPHGYEQVRGAG